MDVVRLPGEDQVLAGLPEPSEGVEGPVSFLEFPRIARTGGARRAGSSACGGEYRHETLTIAKGNGLSITALTTL